MKCKGCGSEDMIGIVTLQVTAPMAAKGGSVKLGMVDGTPGVKVTQVDIKKAWDLTEHGDEKKIRGPIYCGACGDEHHYVVGGNDNPIKGAYAQAQRKAVKAEVAATQDVVEQEEAAAEESSESVDESDEPAEETDYGNDEEILW